MSKERKIQKDKEQSEKEWEKYKNTKCIFGRNRKIQKNTKVQGVFLSNLFCIYFVLFLYFCKIIQNKYKKKRKTIQIQNLKNTKYKKNKPKISKIQKNTNSKSPKYKYKKYKLNIKKRANPMFILGRNNQIAEKMQNQHVVFSTPCSCDFVLLRCIFFVCVLYF